MGLDQHTGMSNSVFKRLRFRGDAAKQPGLQDCFVKPMGVSSRRSGMPPVGQPLGCFNAGLANAWRVPGCASLAGCAFQTDMEASSQANLREGLCFVHSRMHRAAAISTGVAFLWPKRPNPRQGSHFRCDRRPGSGTRFRYRGLTDEARL